VVKPLRLGVVRRTHEQLEVVLSGLSLSVWLAHLCAVRVDCCKGRSSLIRSLYARRIVCVFSCAGDGKLCVPSGRKAFCLERVFYHGLFDTQDVPLGSSSSLCCFCVMP
jgi:hypothetical protein